MRSEKGMSLVRTEIFVAVLILLFGCVAFVVFGDNGVLNRREKEVPQNLFSDDENIVIVE